MSGASKERFQTVSILFRRPFRRDSSVAIASFPSFFFFRCVTSKFVYFGEQLLITRDLTRNHFCANLNFKTKLLCVSVCFSHRCDAVISVYTKPENLLASTQMTPKQKNPFGNISACVICLNIALNYNCNFTADRSREACRQQKKI